MRVPVLPVPSATLAQLSGILTLIHGRANNTVVFVFCLRYHTALATASGTIWYHDRWMMMRTAIPSCTPATLHASRKHNTAVCAALESPWRRRRHVFQLNENGT
jgi:hypothetical protein